MILLRLQQTHREVCRMSFHCPQNPWQHLPEGLSGFHFPVCGVSEHLWTLRAHCFLAKALQTWDKRVPLKREHWALFRFRLKLLMVSAVAPYTCLGKCPSCCSGLSVLPVPFCLGCSVEISLAGFVRKFMQNGVYRVLLSLRICF